MSNIDLIKDNCDIYDVISQAVTLKRAGANYKGRCPFHNEKTASFVVSPQKRIFTCFGCGATGDVIEFTKRYNNLDFQGALEFLAERYGITLEKSRSQGPKKDEYYDINKAAATFFYKRMRGQKNPGLDYAISRGLTQETMHAFGLGYAADTWNELTDYLKSQKFPEHKLVELGLVSKNDKGRVYDKFRSRLMFPIWNTSGKVIGFGGRIIGEGEPKYMNSPENPIFQKKKNLYGLYQSKGAVTKEDQIILVEGNVDVISLYQYGVQNVAASLGTALTKEQAKLIGRYTKNVVLCYDADAAGIKAALRGMDILHEEGLNVKVMHVTDGKDPDDFIKKNGKLAFLELVKNALPFAEYKFSYLETQCDVNDIQGKVKFMKYAAKVLAQLGPVEADLYIRQLSAKYDISDEAIRAEMNKLRNSSQEAPKQEKAPLAEVEISPIEKTLLKVLIIDNKYLNTPDLESMFISQEGHAIFKAIEEASASGGELDLRDVEAFLEDEEQKVLQDINENEIIKGNAQQVFMDCIATAYLMRLKREEKSLRDQLAIAEEEGNEEAIERLLKKLMEVQNKIQLGGC